MYCRAVACDFDGTGATNGRLEPEVAAALSTARTRGLVTLLVTGRLLGEVQALTPDLSMFDAVVAENGAVIHLPDMKRTIQLGLPPPEQFLGELRAHGVPFQAGAVVVGTWNRHLPQVMELIQRFGLDTQPIFNRDALMLLPSGLNKAVGTRRALAELSRSERNLIAFGDAENDLPMLALAEVGIAARQAVGAVVAQADEQLAREDGAGVARYIYQLLELGGTVPTPSRQQVILGTTADGTPAVLPSSGTNVMVTGDPRSGKSWLTGLVSEQLLDHGYRLCVIDPEGDHVSLGERPQVLVLGSDLGLPEPTAVPRLLCRQPMSLVLDLSGLSVEEQATYVDQLLVELGPACAATGLPQWVVVDEAQYFFHEANALARHFGGATNFLFATYRPSLVSDAVCAAVNSFLIRDTAVEEERYFITSLLQTYGPRDLVPADALAELRNGHVGLLTAHPTEPRWQAFAPVGRLTGHTHHGHKYSDTRFPEDKAFRFLGAGNVALVEARSILEFHDAVQLVPISCLYHHLSNRDFSRWVEQVVRDHDLAHGLAKLERGLLAGMQPNRLGILAHIEERYVVQRDTTRAA
jgi:hydroxymethylpyrimidine pyrophosphatase-like HAD family hydrolase